MESNLRLQGIRKRQGKKRRLAALTTSAASARAEDGGACVDRQLKDLMVSPLQRRLRSRYLDAARLGFGGTVIGVRLNCY